MQNQAAKTRNLALITAFMCGALPLGLGTVVFLTWLATGWGWWERAWLWLILFAVACLIIGPVALLRHLRQRQSQPPENRGSSRPASLAGLLLLLIIPAGVAYMMLVVRVLTSYTVEVVNLSNAPVESLVLNGPGVMALEIGPVLPQQRTSKSLRFTGDGKLAYSGRHHGNIHTGILESSTSPDGAGGKLLRITPEGWWEARPR